MWGINEFEKNCTDDYFYTSLPMKRADIIYLCFSLINRPSFEKVLNYSTKLIKHWNKTPKILIGTQADTRDWFVHQVIKSILLFSH